jgi:hypothetical protein
VTENVIFSFTSLNFVMKTFFKNGKGRFSVLKELREAYPGRCFSAGISAHENNCHLMPGIPGRGSDPVPFSEFRPVFLYAIMSAVILSRFRVCVAAGFRYFAESGKTRSGAGRSRSLGFKDF